jgi:hypothetical protein
MAAALAVAVVKMLAMPHPAARLVTVPRFQGPQALLGAQPI